MRILKFWLLSGFFLLAASLSGLDLGIAESDLRIEQTIEGGYYLYIRKKPDVASVMLVESTKDPSKKWDNYAYRSLQYNAENGDEKRKLNGQFIELKDSYSLIDSSPVEDAEFGSAFKIFIPYVLVYGYPFTRYGEVQVMDGTFLSVRAFEKEFGDYDGSFQDNPFVIRVSQKPLSGPPEGNYMPETVRTYTKMAKDTEGKTWYSSGEEDVLDTLRKVLSEQKGSDLDLVLVLDATNSMANDAPFVRNGLVPLILEYSESKKPLRVALVQYRDYLEEFLYKVSPFTSDLDQIKKNIDRYRPMGGRDIPEAVNEALYAALNEVNWISKNRLIILVGDAPPHPIPRGYINASMVEEKAKEKAVKIHTIILPQ